MKSLLDKAHSIVGQRSEFKHLLLDRVGAIEKLIDEKEIEVHHTVWDSSFLWIADMCEQYSLIVYEDGVGVYVHSYVPYEDYELQATINIPDRWENKSVEEIVEEIKYTSEERIKEDREEQIAKLERDLKHLKGLLEEEQ